MAAWNAWRDENPDIDPDLFEADLNGANLRGANLSRANLRGANLRGANLSGTSHMERVLKAGKLIRAGLSETDLMDADLSTARLCRLLYRGRGSYRHRLNYSRLIRRAADRLCERVGRSDKGSGRPVLWRLRKQE